ncbi:MAG: putative manganese-dependent inorganic diphosphatase [Anaerorhabdus sp.]|uniref:putative manganese-dependent inorganic diphosphatase n=1 Tax=Anaerorhabdus sp. TaxID=1872524 RepID=UPI002FC90EB9
MRDVIYVTGHRNPDTDSICSSIAYANLKQQLGQNAIACRIGELNTETAYVLKKFDVEAPKLVENAKCRLEDIDIDSASLIHSDLTIKRAWEKITLGKNKSLFVVDSENNLLGVVSMSNISDVQMKDIEQVQELMKDVPISNITETIEGKLLINPTNLHMDGDVKIMISRNNNFLDEEFENSVIIMSDNEVLQEKAIEKKAACLVITEGKEVSQKIMDMAIANDCAIITTPYDAMKVARYIYQTPPVSMIMTKDIVTFKISDYVDDVSKRMSKTRYRSYPVIDHKGHVIGAVSRFHLFSYTRKKFVLLDHNEASQSVESLEVADVLEIIDHHRIGDIETSNPINFRNQNLGSTSSIIALMYKENGIKPTKKIAGLLCCAIISDTMNFNSPTATAVDRDIATDLAAIAEIDLDKLSIEMFEAVATLRGLSFSEILYNDFKEYSMEGFRIAIGQINILDIKELEIIRREFVSYMEKINAINKYDLLVMTFTNVEGKGSNFIYMGKLSWVIEEMFDSCKENDVLFAKDIVSRKKQIIPRLAAALKLA